MSARGPEVKEVWVAIATAGICAAAALMVGLVASFLALPMSAGTTITEIAADSSGNYFGAITFVWLLAALASSVVAYFAARSRRRETRLYRTAVTAMLSAGPVLAFMVLPWTSVGGAIYRNDQNFTLEGPVALLPAIYVVGFVATLVGCAMVFGGERSVRRGG